MKRRIWMYILIISCALWMNPFCGEAAVKGDLDSDYDITLADEIICLQILDDIALTKTIGTVSDIDINGDVKIGLEEAVYILQVVAEFRDVEADQSCTNAWYYWIQGEVCINGDISDAVAISLPNVVSASANAVTFSSMTLNSIPKAGDKFAFEAALSLPSLSAGQYYLYAMLVENSTSSNPKIYIAVRDISNKIVFIEHKSNNKWRSYGRITLSSQNITSYAFKNLPLSYSVCKANNYRFIVGIAKDQVILNDFSSFYGAIFSCQ